MRCFFGGLFQLSMFVRFLLVFDLLLCFFRIAWCGHLLGKGCPLGFSLVLFLAHLSRRLTRWAYSIAMVLCPSVVVHTFKLEYLWSQLADLYQILCVASLGWGKGCIRFWGRFDQNSGFHGNRKPQLTYNGENNVSTFSWLFLIRSFLYLQVTRTGIKSRTSSNLGQVGPQTTELAALECRKNFP